MWHSFSRGKHPLAASVLAVLALGLGQCGYYGFRFHQLDEQLYVVQGQGGNSGVLFSDTAILIVDTKMKQGATQLRNWVAKKAKGQRVYVVNTHLHRDHSGGNHLYNDAVIIAGNYGARFWNAMAAKEDMPNLWLADQWEIAIGDEPVLIMNVGQAHTFSDLIVYLKKRKVLFCGDVVLNGYHPFFDERVGSSLPGYLEALQALDTLKVSTVVPGHGDLGDKGLIKQFYQYFFDMQLAAGNMHKEMEARDRYRSWISLPINKAGFDQTLAFIRTQELPR